MDNIVWGLKKIHPTAETWLWRDKGDFLDKLISSIWNRRDFLQSGTLKMSASTEALEKVRLFECLHAEVIFQRWVSHFLVTVLAMSRQETNVFTLFLMLERFWDCQNLWPTLPSLENTSHSMRVLWGPSRGCHAGNLGPLPGLLYQTCLYLLPANLLV